MDVYFMQVQGSGIGVTEDGRQYKFVYAGKNNMKFTPYSEFLAKNQNFPGEWYIEEKMKILAPLSSLLVQETLYENNAFKSAEEPRKDLKMYQQVEDFIDQHKLKTFVPLCEINKKRKDKYDSNYYKNYYKLMFGDEVQEPCYKDWHKEIFGNKSDGLEKVNDAKNKIYKK